jgi:hypothetical protein
MLRRIWRHTQLLLAIVALALPAHVSAADPTGAGSSGLECPRLMVGAWQSRERQWIQSPPTDAQCKSLTSIADNNGPYSMERSGSSTPFNSFQYCKLRQRAMDCRTAWVDAGMAEKKRREAEENKERAAEQAQQARQTGKESAEDAARRQEAAQLAKDLGLPPPSSTKGGSSSGSDAKSLAQQLGVGDSGAKGEYTAAQLQNDMRAWEEKERIRLEEAREQEARRVAWEREQEIDREKRAEILSEQQMTAMQRQQEAAAREQQMREDEKSEQEDASEGGGFWSTLIGAAATGVVAKQLGGDPRAAVGEYARLTQGGAIAPSPAPSSSYSSSSDEANCRTDPAIVSRTQSIIENCPTTGRSICGDARAEAACYGQMASEFASCPSVAAQARSLQRQSLDRAALACGR